MARETEGKKRASNGDRSRSRAVHKGGGSKGGAQSDDPSESDRHHQKAGRHGAARRTEQLLILSLAIIFALAGFPFHVLWIMAIVLMALLWGYMASELGSSRRGGVVTDVVTTIASEARDLKEDISDSASSVPDEVLDGTGRTADGGEPRSSGAQMDSQDQREPTKQELYDQARDADIEGRSSMTKDQLKEALDE